ncbi:hypothetical protein M3Y94_01165300 [Aphelenchoides besseyi]|nr:hypothetical protein M3Y94_01165300 [Aphelenchoides besseyi]
MGWKGSLIAGCFAEIIKTKMRIRRTCPSCQNFVDEKWTLRGFLSAIFCFPCICFVRRRKRLHCPNCDIDVIVADGSIPRIVQTYKYYHQYQRAEALQSSLKKHQFEAPVQPSDQQTQ